MEASEFRRADINYEHLYGDLFTLMKNAGTAVSQFVTRTYGTNRKILVVCGKGNNGGDGFVAATGLSQNNDVTAIAVEGKSATISKQARRAMRSFKGKIVSMANLDEVLRESDIVIDALLGTGIAGTPKYPYDVAIRKINSSGKVIVSVDVPSGIGSDLAVKPTYTVTFSQPKDGMNSKNSGKIEVADIGIPADVFRYAGPGDLIYYIFPKPDSHKGMNGTLAILGGLEFYGSAVIAAEGANGVGVDLVRIFTSSQNYQIIGSYDPGYIVRIIGEDQDDLVSQISKNTAILAGSGNGLSEMAGRVLELALELKHIPLVLDADAVKLLAKSSFTGRQNLVITPNKNEFRILTGKDPTEENAVKYAVDNNMVVVLKGKEDIVASPGRTIVVQGGNPRMTMGGTGDLLAGVIGGFCSKGVNPFRASVMGCYIMKQASEVAHSQYGLWYNINHLASIIPVTMNELFLSKKD
ncbi:MAG: NAD(P)H-hydrate dehydratase [Thermoplasmataceae archaeon]